MEEEKQNMIQTALDAGLKIAELKVIPEGSLEETRVLVPEGMKLEILKTQVSPARKSGEKIFFADKSFCEYVNKHKDLSATIIIADENEGKVKAIFNDHGASSPGFSDFCAVLDIGFSKQFQTWLHKAFNSREYRFTQAEFADFIEDNRVDLMVGNIEREGQEIKNLSGLELSDLINNLQISAEVNLTAKRNAQDDQVHYEYEVKDSGKCQFRLPKSIFLAIPIYKYGDVFRIELRLRSSGKSGGTPRFWYIIDQLEVLKERAFDKICKRIKNGNEGSEPDEGEQFEGTGIEVWKGQL